MTTVIVGALSFVAGVLAGTARDIIRNRRHPAPARPQERP